MNIKKGDILVAKDNFTMDETGSDVPIDGSRNRHTLLYVFQHSICLTKDKHYEVIRIDYGTEIVFVNDAGNQDFFIEDGEDGDVHNYRNFFYTLKEVREMKLKELGV